MTPPIAPNHLETTPQNRSKMPAWTRPTVSPEHGVYVVLLVSLLTGAAAAQQWTGATTLAMICAFFGFQAEHPLVVQIRQRKSLKPRLLLWGSIYGGIATTIALYLYWQSGALFSPLPWIYGMVIGALIFDGVSVLHREQKSVVNEFITFTAVCLATPFVYVSTTGNFSAEPIGLWLLNTLFFSSSILTVKLRKLKQDESLDPATQQLIFYHILAAIVVFGLYEFDILSLFTTLSFGILLVKVGGILWQRQWYRTTQIRHVALIETLSALLFFVIVVVSILPAHLTVR